MMTARGSEHCKSSLHTFYTSSSSCPLPVLQSIVRLCLGVQRRLHPMLDEHWQLQHDRPACNQRACHTMDAAGGRLCVLGASAYGRSAGVHEAMRHDVSHSGCPSRPDGLTAMRVITRDS